MKLKREERKAIFDGDHRALRRPEEPKVDEGEVLVLSWTKGGQQFVERTHDDRRKAAERGDDLTIEIPRKPAFWITPKKPRLKDGEWIVEFDVHDERERTRMLGGPPSPQKEAGLKTRWGKEVRSDGSVKDKKVPKRGEHRESFTTESERGYGAGGKAAVDEREGVDDATLNDYAKRIAEENELRQKHKHNMAEALRRERMVAKEYRKGNLSGARAAKRRAERAAKRGQA